MPPSFAPSSETRPTGYEQSASSRSAESLCGPHESSTFAFSSAGQPHGRPPRTAYGSHAYAGQTGSGSYDHAGTGFWGFQAAQAQPGPPGFPPIPGMAMQPHGAWFGQYAPNPMPQSPWPGPMSFNNFPPALAQALQDYYFPQETGSRSSRSRRRDRHQRSPVRTVSPPPRTVLPRAASSPASVTSVRLHQSRSRSRSPRASRARSPAASRSRSSSRSRSRSASRSRSRSRSPSRSPPPPPPRRSSDPLSFERALEVLRSVCPDQVAVSEVQDSCRPGTDFLLGESERGREVLVTKQTPFISSLLSSLSREVRGEKEDHPLSSTNSLAVPPPISLEHGSAVSSTPLPALPAIGPKAMRAKGHFFRPSAKLRPRKAAIVEHSSLPRHPLSLTDTCKSVLSRSAPSQVKVSFTDKSAQEWEELARRGLESASFSESMLNAVAANLKPLGSKNALPRHLSEEESTSLLWAMGRSIQSLSDCLGRLYWNIILARRDGHLEHASARIPPDCIPRIRALPVQEALFGPQVAATVGQANATAVTDQFLALAKARPTNIPSRQSHNRGSKRSAPPPRLPSPKRPRSNNYSRKSSRGPKKNSSSKGHSKGTGHPQ